MEIERLHNEGCTKHPDGWSAPTMAETATKPREGWGTFKSKTHHNRWQQNHIAGKVDHQANRRNQETGVKLRRLLRYL